MNYTNVTHKDDTISAYTGTNDQLVLIHKSISVLYRYSEEKHPVARNGVVYQEVAKCYIPITYTSQKAMLAVEKLIMGDRYLRQEEIDLLKTVYVRFGWLDRTLGQLRWVPLIDLVESFVRKELEGTEKGKFQEICKMLSLSLKVARSNHEINDKLYDPRKSLYGDLGHYIPEPTMPAPVETVS